mgnify:CR=1 FL=1
MNVCQLLDELTLDFEAEFKTLGAGGFNGLPIISSRRFVERVRLKFGEYAIVAGLLSVVGVLGDVATPRTIRRRWTAVKTKTTRCSVQCG